MERGDATVHDEWIGTIDHRPPSLPLSRPASYAASRPPTRTHMQAVPPVGAGGAQGRKGRINGIIADVACCFCCTAASLCVWRLSVHGSTGNGSDRPRKTYVMAFRDVKVRPHHNTHAPPVPPMLVA